MIANGTVAHPVQIARREYLGNANMVQTFKVQQSAHAGACHHQLITLDPGLVQHVLKGQVE